jgi:endonuclease/exonuclease/phosphatase family metal-dependent hydrolase
VTDRIHGHSGWGKEKASDHTPVWCELEEAS